MRTGAEYREALRDGRSVWVMGEGRIADVTTHPATCAMVDEYARWYDRHFDPTWRDVLLSPHEAEGERVAGAYVAPQRAEDLIGIGRSFARTLFLSARQRHRHPGLRQSDRARRATAVQAVDRSPDRVAAAFAYRDDIARSGRFLTFCGGAPIIGQRLRPSPAERVALKPVRETDAGVVLSGRLGMHTSPAGSLP